MRFIVGAVALGLFAERVDASAVCSTAVANWYPNMMNCVYNKADLAACMSAYVGTDPALDSALSTVLGTSNACTTCLTNFFTTAKLKFSASELTTPCGATYTSSGVGASGCLLALYDDLNTFNTCNGGGKDLVTGATSTRCTYDQFAALEADFLPYGSMATLVKASVLVTAYRAGVGSTFDARLLAVPCGSCYDTLYSALKLLGSFATSCADAYSATCLTYIDVPLQAFAVCTGGFILHTATPTRCVAAEKALVETVFRPYFGIVACRASSNTNSAYSGCLAEYTGLEDAPSTACESCFSAFHSAVALQAESACSSPGSIDCLASLTGVYGALPEFKICAGYEMDRTSTRCTYYEWSHMDASSKSYADILIEAIRMSDQFAAATMIATSSYLTGLSLDRFNVGCSSCFDAFAADVFTAYTSSSTTRVACTNAYSEACYFDDNIAVALDRFRTCSGYDLPFQSFDRCAATEITAMLDSAASATIIAFALNSTTSTALTTAYTTAMSAVGTSKVPTTCAFCFWNLVKAMFELTTAAKTSCSDDLNGELCQTAAGNITAAFAACSGFDLNAVLTTTSSSTTTTSPTTASTTASTTESTTYTTPTTKSATRIASLSLALVALCAAGL